MRLTIEGERSVRLDTAGTGFEVTGGDFGPLELLAASLAACTAAVVSTYGVTARLDLHGFAVGVRWEYADRPQRVAAYTVTLLLPATVPPERHGAILRAAETCTVHNTLRQPPRITTAIATAGSAPG